MSQHDMVVANDTGANVRSDINNALAALVTLSAGATAPATTFAYMLWADTANNRLKIRNAANSAWIEIGTLDGAGIFNALTVNGAVTVNTTSANVVTVNRSSGGASAIAFQQGGVSKGFVADNGDGIDITKANGTTILSVTATGAAVTGTVSASGTAYALTGSITGTVFEIASGEQRFVTAGVSGNTTLNHNVYNGATYQTVVATTKAGVAVTGDTSTTGLLLVGTTTDGAGSGTGALRMTVDANGLNGAAILKNAASASFTANVWNAATSGDNQFLSFGTEGTYTTRGSIDYNRGGGLTRYNTSSDATLKNVAGDAPVGISLDILRATRMRHYTWRDDPEQKLQLGPIAQELHEVFKGAVSVGGLRDVMEPVYEDVYGEVDEDVIEDLIGDITEPVFEDAFNGDGEKIGVVQVGERVVGQGVVGQVKTGTRRVTKVVGRKQVDERKIGERYQPWGVDKTAFSFHLVVGFQYLDAETQALKAEVAELRQRIAALEAK
jgi:hypothetical protein